jgi:hypothetical protein
MLLSFLLSVTFSGLDEHTSLLCNLHITYMLCFIIQTPGVHLIKLFWHRITHTFWKLDYLIKISTICCIAMKGSSIQERICKFTTKKFYEIDPGGLFYKTFLRSPFTDICNKLECLSLASLSSLV